MRWKTGKSTTRRKRKPVGSALTIRNKVSKLSYQVKGLRKASENKHYDYNDVHTFMNSSTDGEHWALLTAMDQGTQESQRIGNQIAGKFLHLKINLKGVDGVSAIDCFVRMVLVRDNGDRQDAGAPAWSDLLEVSTDPTRVRSHYLMNKRPRFTVLYDKTISMPVSGSSGHYKTITIKRKLPWHMDFDGVNSTDLTFNHVYFAFVTDAIDPLYCTMQISSRFTYAG